MKQNLAVVLGTNLGVSATPFGLLKASKFDATKRA